MIAVGVSASAASPSLTLGKKMKSSARWSALLVLNAAVAVAQPNWGPPPGWTAVQPLNLKLDGFHLAGAWNDQKTGVGVVMMAMPAIKSDTEVRDSVAGWVSGNVREGLLPVDLGYIKMGALHGFRASGPYSGPDDDYWLDSYIFCRC